MAGTSALLKNASSIRDQLASYQDSLQNFEYSNSAFTDTALASYSDYLQKRIDALNGTNSISGASKALSLTKSLDSATKQNISATIQRENIQVLSGNATPTDKYNVLVGQYARAVGNGDLTLAQGLMSQAYSLSQTIQLQRQQAADASAALAKAGASQTAGGQEHVATNLKVSLQQLNKDIQTAGSKDFNKTVAKWVSTNSDSLKALGVSLPKGAQPNYFDVVSGVAGAIYNAHMLAYQAELPYNPDTAQGYYNSAMELAGGISNLPTLAGSKSIQEIQAAASSNSQFVYNPSQGKFVQTQQTGNAFHIDQNGAPVLAPTYSGTIEKTIVLSPAQTTLMSKLGLNFSESKNGVTGNGVQVQATAQSPAWIKNILGNNGATNLFNTPEGLQFTYNSKSGEGLSTYTIVKDAHGLYGVAEESNMGTHILNGEYGFNPTGGVSSNHSQSFFDKLKTGVVDSAGSIINGGLGLLGGHASAQSLLGNATGNYKAPAPLALAPLPALPTIAPAAPAPLPSLHVPVTAPTPATRSVSQAAPVASPAKSPQNPGGVNLQGGSFSLQ